MEMALVSATRLPSTAAKRAKTRTKKRVTLRARELARLRCSNLELDVMNLRQEIATLETLRKLLYERTLNRPDDRAQGSFVKTVREYYTLMRYGFSRDGAPSGFFEFMVAAFDPALAVGDAEPHPRGLERCMEDIAFKAKLGGRVSVELVQTAVRKADAMITVVATVAMTSALTAFLLDVTFPHVRQFPWLREKLIGRAITITTESFFEFNVATGRIERFAYKLDPMAAILAVVDTAAEYKLLSGQWRRDGDGDL